MIATQMYKNWSLFENLKCWILKKKFVYGKQCQFFLKLKLTSTWTITSVKIQSTSLSIKTSIA